MKNRILLILPFCALSMLLCAASEEEDSAPETADVATQSDDASSAADTDKAPAATPSSDDADALAAPDEDDTQAEGTTDESADDEKTPAEDDAGEEAPKKDITLNFENTDLSNFIQYMAELKKLTLIPDKNTQNAKISLNMHEPLDVDGAWNIFLTVMETAGFSIVKVGDVYKVMTKDSKSTEPLPLYINVPADTLPDSDLTVRYITFLNNIGADDVKDFVSGMLSKDNKTFTIPAANALVITDRCYHIKSAMKVVNELDQTGLKETISVIDLKQTQATEVKKLLDDLKNNRQDNGNPLARFLGRQVTDAGPDYFSSDTKIVAEERTNRLILMGNQKAISKIENFITTYVDTELKATKSPLHIYELQYADASQVKDILDQVSQSNSDSPAAKYGGVRNGVKYFKNLAFQVDDTGNRLIVSSTDKQDWKLIKKTIQDLDKPQPQVGIETLVVSVDVTDDKALGGSVRLKRPGMLGKNVGFQAANHATSDGTGIIIDETKGLLANLISFVSGAPAGSAVFALGKGANIWAVFDALKNESTTTILSNPFVTVSNRVKATVSVGETRRIVSGNAVSSSGQPGIDEFEDKSASTKISYTPQINMDGIINMGISVSIDDFQAGSGGVAGDTTNRELKTNVTVANGQVLVLGGFVKTKASETVSKTPGLSSIPLLGWLFKRETRSTTKSYIFIFVCPTLCKPRQTPGVELYTKMKLHQATDHIAEAVQTEIGNDPIHNWFFNPDKEEYTHKVIDYANARYQPTTVDIRNDDYYRSLSDRAEKQLAQQDDARLVQQDTATQELVFADPLPAQKPIALADDKPVTPVDEGPVTPTDDDRPVEAIKQNTQEQAPKPPTAEAELFEEVAPDDHVVVKAPPLPKTAFKKTPKPAAVDNAYSKKLLKKTLTAQAAPPAAVETPQENALPTPQSNRNRLKAVLSQLATPQAPTDAAPVAQHNKKGRQGVRA